MGIALFWAEISKKKDLRGFGNTAVLGSKIIHFFAS